MIDMCRQSIECFLFRSADTTLRYDAQSPSLLQMKKIFVASVARFVFEVNGVENEPIYSKRFFSLFWRAGYGKLVECV